MATMSDERQYHHGGLREALLAAAEASVRSRGTAQLSLRDLARDVGVSHAAPRRHFTDRQSLLDALAETGYHRLGTEISEALHTASVRDGFPARVRTAVGAFGHFATDNPALLELMNASKHRGSQAVGHASTAAFEPIVELVREGQAEGVLRGETPEEIGLILYSTINGITTLRNAGAIGADRLEELTDTVVEQFLRGAAP